VRTFVVTAAALLTLTGCSAGGKASATASLAHSPAAASPATPTVKPAARPKARKTAKGAPPKAGACDPGPDLLVWFIAPGAPASAQALGSYDSPACRAAGRSTLASLKQVADRRWFLHAGRACEPEPRL
jgi:hypothetical protein